MPRYTYRLHQRSIWLPAILGGSTTSRESSNADSFRLMTPRSPDFKNRILKQNNSTSVGQRLCSKIGRIPSFSHSWSRCSDSGQFEDPRCRLRQSLLDTLMWQLLWRTSRLSVRTGTITSSFLDIWTKFQDCAHDKQCRRSINHAVFSPCP